jgi:hypothetical protein
MKQKLSKCYHAGLICTLEHAFFLLIAQPPIANFAIKGRFPLPYRV